MKNLKKLHLAVMAMLRNDDGGRPAVDRRMCPDVQAG
jgi:hypothetical protein